MTSYIPVPRDLTKVKSKDMPDEVERKGLGTPATRAGVIEKLVQNIKPVKFISILCSLMQAGQRVRIGLTR